MIWIIKEEGYYETEGEVLGWTTKKEVADSWKNHPQTEVIEIDEIGFAPILETVYEVSFYCGIFDEAEYKVSNINVWEERILGRNASRGDFFPRLVAGSRISRLDARFKMNASLKAVGLPLRLAVDDD